ncbi:protocadherin Fat 4 [Elysia marginata]|uniref:Protocadherin Fat 4 n=1 Tax=Elysia marginata TaxID=1093978 RepID=A0AAV4IUK6_9GAST|nr:protocadherin Fat 4 [Elysia marginata]
MRRHIVEYLVVTNQNDKGVPAKSTTGTLTFTIEDVSDEPIVCDTSLYTATIPENDQNSFLDVAVSCTKNDGIAAGLIEYTITSGDDNGNFELDFITGDLFTSAAASLDYENVTSYTLTVTAAEGGETTNVTVKVTVTDVNEFSPEFTPAGPYSISLDENVGVGHTVTIVNGTDEDLADLVKVYAISSGNSEGKFKLDSSSGVLQVQAALDHETTPSYSLTLTVTDSGGSTGNVVVNIAVNDVNDNSPVCTETSDTVATPTLDYSIVAGDNPSIAINASTGELYLNSALDYETNSSLLVVIEVSDLDTPTAKTATVEVTFVVNPINEHDPVFTPSDSYGPFSVKEDESTGTSVAQVTASDADEGSDHGTVSFAIVSGDDAQQFAVDATTGVISVVKPLDRETIASYELVIRATDETAGDAGQRSASATVNITITDINDLSPTFNPVLYNVDVQETASFGPAVVLKTLTVTDGDEGDNAVLNLTITSGDDQGRFSIDGNDVILSAALDYENTTSYDLVITATDGGTLPLSAIARLTVNVLPDNEVAPLMSAASAAAEISEETPVGTLVYDANATDTDTGNSDGTITYSISSGVTGNEFTIDSATGQLYVGSQLDFDQAPTSYAIIISAQDGAGLSDASTSTVSLTVTLTDENDNVPQFSTSMFTFSVEEGVPTGTTVGTIVVTDDDSGVNGDVTLEITGGSGSSFFAVDAATGEITTGADIDYEAFQVLYLSIKATDGGTPPLTSAGLVKIDVTNMNDNAPVLTPAEFAVTISESVVSGSSVFTFTSSDLDTSIDAISFVSASSFFEIDSATGLITTKSALDRETIDSHALQIQVLDLPTSGDPATVRSSTANLTIIIQDENDNDPTITGSYSPSIDENSALNTLVFTVAASDPDAGANGQLTYEITAGNTGAAFSIDSSGNVLVAAPLDRETTASYTLTIVVSDQGTPPRTDQIDVTVTIDDVNDNDPIEIQSSFSFSVEEDSSVDTSVGTVVATDADAGSNAVLVYSLDSFSIGNASHFKIDSASGEITVAEADLDRETTDVYQATVKVTDSGVSEIRTTFATVIINIDDLNDNAPIMSQSSYTGSVAEDADNSTVVVTVVATDADAGVNADITYTMNTTLLDGATASSFFEVDASSGEVRPYTSLDYEMYQKFTFIVEAEDGGTPSLIDTATVTVSITDVNDKRPVFNPTFYNTEVAYDGTCASTIATVTATDADSGNNGQVSYSLQTTAFTYLFSVDATWGAVTLTSVASVGISYHLEIQATDAGSPSTLSASTPATVRVDSFIPNTHVVTIRLAISRTDFVSQQSTFLADLQTVIRNTYPTALVRLWCLSEYSGTAVSPPTGRRRLLADQPVDVHTYVLQDDSTDSESNLGSGKTILSQDELLALVSNLEGSTWDYYQIVSVSEYYQSTEGWFDTLHGKVITAVACFLGLVLIALLIYMAAECCCGNGFRRTQKKPKRNGSPKISKVEPRVELDSLPPSRASTAQGGTKPLKAFWDNNWAPAGLPDALAHEDLSPDEPASVPPPYSQDEESGKPVSPVSGRGSSSLPRTPRSVFFSESETPLGDGHQEFDGRALDHATGKVYEYNTKTNERRWIQ